MSYTASPGNLIQSFAMTAVPTLFEVMGPPGAGRAYRLVSLYIAMQDTATGTIQILMRETGASVNLAVVCSAEQRSPFSQLLIPAPGIQLAENSGLECSYRGSGAVGSFRVGWMYYTDILT